MQPALQAITPPRTSGIVLPPHLALGTCRHGTMLYAPHDRFIGGALARYGEFSEGEQELFRQMIRLGDTVVEVGANIGAHTVPLARLAGPAGRVLAFEPQRAIFQMLCANLALNGLAQVQATQAALGAAPGELHVPPIDYTGAGNFGGIALATEGGDPVPVTTLDALGLPALRLLKVDVEGMEADVLKGGRDTIARTRPLLYVENDREEKSASLIRLVLGMGYRLFWHLPRMFNPQNWRGVAENGFGPIISINMVGVPAEQPVRTDMREIADECSHWRV
jgi:FkbM family methyltransferase